MPTIEVGQDIVDVAQALLKRVYTLEQRITSPSYVVPNGSSPTFKDIIVGDWSPDNETVNGIPIQSQVGTPTNLVLTTSATFEDVSIDASWQAPADGSAASYEVGVHERQADGSYLPVRIVSVLGTNAHINGLFPNRTYGVNVKAVNRIGVVSAPLPASGFQDIATGKDATIPVALTGFRATSGMSSVMVQWDESTDADVRGGAGQYQVEIADDTNFTVNVSRTVTSATLVSFSGLEVGKRYYFRVRAVDSSGNEGPWTTGVWAEPGGASGGASTDGLAPSAAPSVTVRDATGFIWVRWNAIANADPVTYEVFMGTGTSFVLDDTTKVGETDATFAVIKTDGANNPIPYDSARYFVVRPRDEDGIGPSSAVSAAAYNRQTGSADIAAGTITYESAIIASLDAGKIIFGQMSGDRIQANTISSGHVVTGGLDAGVIKFGSMHGDRITANTMQINAITSSTLTSRTIWIGSGGQFVIGNSTNGVYIDQFGVRVFSGGATKVHLSNDGNAYFKGDITGATGTFSGAVRASSMIGGRFMTSDATNVNRIVIDGNSTSGYDKRNRITFYGASSTVVPAYLEVFDYMYGANYGQVLRMDSGRGTYQTYNGNDRTAWLQLQPDYGTGSDGFSMGVNNSKMIIRGAPSQGIYILSGGADISIGPATDLDTNYPRISIDGSVYITSGNNLGQYAVLYTDAIYPGGLGHDSDAVRIGNNLQLIGQGAGTQSAHPHVFASGTNMRLGTQSALYVQHPTTGAYRVVYASSFSVQSAENSKRDIAKHDKGMAALKKIRPVKFRKKSDPDGPEVLGVIAEEVAAAIPEAAVMHQDDNEEQEIVVVERDELGRPVGTKKVKQMVRMGASPEDPNAEPGTLFGVDPMGLISALLAGLQEVDARLDTLEAARRTGK